MNKPILAIIALLAHSIICQNFISMNQDTSTKITFNKAKTNNYFKISIEDNNGTDTIMNFKEALENDINFKVYKDKYPTEDNLVWEKDGSFGKKEIMHIPKEAKTTNMLWIVINCPPCEEPDSTTTISTTFSLINELMIKNPIWTDEEFTFDEFYSTGVAKFEIMKMKFSYLHFKITALPSHQFGVRIVHQDKGLQCYDDYSPTNTHEAKCTNDYSVDLYYDVIVTTNFDPSVTNRTLKIFVTAEKFNFLPMESLHQLSLSPTNSEIFLQYNSKKMKGDNVIRFKNLPHKYLRFYAYETEDVVRDIHTGYFEEYYYAKESNMKEEEIMNIPGNPIFKILYIVLHYYGKEDHSNTLSMKNELDFVENYYANSAIEYTKLYSFKTIQFTLLKMNDVFFGFQFTPGDSQQLDVKIYDSSENSQVSHTPSMIKPQELKIKKNLEKPVEYNVVVQVTSTQVKDFVFKAIVLDYILPTFVSLTTWEDTPISLKSDVDLFYKYTAENMADSNTILNFERAISEGVEIFVYLYEDSVRKNSKGYFNSVWNSTSAGIIDNKITINFPQVPDNEWTGLYIIFHCATCSQAHENVLSIINEKEYIKLSNGYKSQIAFSDYKKGIRLEIKKPEGNSVELRIDPYLKNNIKVTINKPFGNNKPLLTHTNNTSILIKRTEEHEAEVVYQVSVILTNGFQNKDEGVNIHYFQYPIEVEEIKEINKPIELNFNDNNKFGYFFDLKGYKLNAEGAITLSFESEVDDMPGKMFRIYGKIVRSNDDGEIKGKLVEIEAENEFDYRIDDKRHIRMFFNKHLDLINYDKVAILVYILFQNTQPSLKAKLSTSPISKTLTLLGYNPINLQEIKLKGYIPYFVRLERSSSKPKITTLIYSEANVNIYEGSLLNGKKMNSHKSKKIFSIERKEVKQTIILEFFGPENTIQYQLEDTEIKVNEISVTVNNINDSIAFRCESIGDTEYYAVELEDKITTTEYYVFPKTIYGLFNFYLNSLNELDESGTKVSIFPKDDDTLDSPKVVESTSLIVKKVCKSLGLSELKFMGESPKTIPIEGDTKPTEVMLSESLYTVEVPDKVNPSPNSNLNIEIRLSHVTDADTEVVITENPKSNLARSKETRFKKITLNNEDRVAFISDITNDLNIKNTKGKASMSLKVAENSFGEVKSGEGLKQQNIYYKLADSNVNKYLFSFTKVLGENLEIAYEIGKGTDNFISKPVQEKTKIENAVFKYTVENPFNKKNDLTPGEFFYVAFSFSKDYINYDLNIQPDYLPDNELIESNKMTPLKGKSKINLKRGEDPKKDRLVVFVSQCKKQNYNMQLFYDNSMIGDLPGKKLREVFNFDNNFMDRSQIKYEYTDNEEHSYYLSYNYLTQEATDNIKSAVEKDYTIIFDQSTNKLTWNNPASSIIKHQIYLSKKEDNINLSSECDMLGSGKKVDEVAGGSEVVLKDTQPGKYVVNILAVNEVDIPYHIAYQSLEIEVLEQNTTSPFWIYIGIGIGIIAIVFIASIVYFIQRNKSFQVYNDEPQEITL